MSWVFLGIAILCEVTGTTLLKLSAGLTKFWPTISMLFFYCLSFISLGLALRVLEVSVAYAIWCGFGIILITLIDIFEFKTHLTYMQLLAIGFIVFGSVMLNILHK